MLGGVNFVLVHVQDIDEARDFYTEKLGMTVELQQPGFMQFAVPGDRGATYALSADNANGNAEQSGGTELWWMVENADAAHAELSARGVEVATPPVDMPFGRTFSIQDPAGNTLYLLQPSAA